MENKPGSRKGELKQARVAILVKALPQPSKTYGETVCCAGVMLDGSWKRLFPVRYRHLAGVSSFSRWDWVDFTYRRPTSDPRVESCHVFEDTIRVAGQMPVGDRSPILTSLIRPSGEAAAAMGESLALVRPRNSRFVWKTRTRERVELAKQNYAQAARQTSIFDRELAALEPTPYEFRFRFEDDAGHHDYQNGDWEAHTMFWRETRRTSAAQALQWMDHIFNEEYPRKGMVFAIGNMMKRPLTWQLLGVIRLNDEPQLGLF